jgi:outer membrane protein assembly factor BamB
MNTSRFLIGLGIVLCLVLSLTIAIIPANTAQAQPAASPWPMFGQNPQRTARSPYSGPDVAKLKWSFTTGGDVYSSPTIGPDGTIYVGSDDDNLYAVNPDGSQKRTLTTGDYVHSSPAIGADGTIYVGSSDDKLYAINPNGSQKWTFTTGDRVNSSPAIGADGTIYVGSRDGSLYAINPNGSQKWSFATGARVYSSPAIGANGTIYVGSDDYNLYATDPDGSQWWSFATGGEVKSSPAIGADGTIYVGSNDGKLYAINPNGSQKWSFTTGGSIYSSAAIGADGTIYVGATDGRLYAINPNGSQKWSFITGGSVYSSAAIGADGTIYVGSHDNKLYAITGGYDLTISSTAGGSVTAPGEGTFPYDQGTVVNLVAEPDEDYRFVKWSGDIATIADVDVASTTISMNDNYSISANFEQIPPQFDLTISRTAGGSVTAPGEGTFTYDQGTRVNIVAKAEQGYRFANWSGDVDTIADVGAASTTVTVEGNYEITAKFAELGGCFIATATYGTPMAEEIEILRQFRDGYLLTNSLGQALVEFYYRVSPPIAEFITEHPSLKPIVRAGLLPAVTMSAVVANSTPAEKTATIGLLVLVSVAVIAWAVIPSVSERREK